MFIGTGCTVSFNAKAIGEILDISPPQESRSNVQTSHMGTTSSSHTFTPTDLIDWGSVVIECAFDASDAFNGTSQAIEAVYALGTKSMIITFADSATSTWTFDCFLTGYEPSMPLEDRMTARLTFKVTGDVSVA